VKSSWQLAKKRTARPCAKVPPSKDFGAVVTLVGVTSMIENQLRPRDPCANILAQWSAPFHCIARQRASRTKKRGVSEMQAINLLQGKR
jgi:hypothetical protein